MNKLVITILSCIITASGFAQSPDKMSYQAVIRNSSNKLVANTAVGMRVSILQTSATGTAVYVETQKPTTNLNGLASIEIGSGIVVSGTFATIDWSKGPYFIKTETDPAGGTSYTISGTSQLLSVPYALYAKTAGNSTNHFIGELYGGGIIVAVWKENGVEHGIIASLTDLSAGMTWSNITDKEIGTAAKSPIDGQANTKAIIAQAGHTASAAKLCDDYSAGGFSDWYLPAIWELNHCYYSAIVVNSILGNTNGFTAFAGYWSSTETLITYATIIQFAGGTGSGQYKSTNTLRVRAVRRF